MSEERSGKDRRASKIEGKVALLITLAQKRDPSSTGEVATIGGKIKAKKASQKCRYYIRCISFINKIADDRMKRCTSTREALTNATFSNASSINNLRRLLKPSHSSGQ